MDNRSHIVVVEDEATQRKLLVDYLARQKYRVTGVDGGIALRKLVERELPALVLLDILPAAVLGRQPSAGAVGARADVIVGPLGVSGLASLKGDKDGDSASLVERVTARLQPKRARLSCGD
jgi:hypothetical protein